MFGIELTHARRQAGFTLIEMSIVLVIIGLIIGGILKGQEIIESSRQKNLIVELDSLRSATGTFVDRFQALPGDYAFAASSSSALARISTDTNAYKSGDGNGVIGTAAPSGATGMANYAANVANTENIQYFVHLFGARLIGGVTPSSSLASTFGEGSPLPAAAFPGTGLTIMYASYDSDTNDVKVGHWVRINKKPAGQGPGLSPKAMYAIDSKTDDGIPSRGVFRSGLDDAACGTNTGINDYSAANESLICTALVVMAN